MPQPKQVDVAASELVRLYREAQDRLIGRYAALVDNHRLTIQQARIRELLRAVDAELAHLHASTSTWAATRLPAIYAAGAGAASLQITGAPFQWAAVHRDATQALAETMWNDFLAQTGHVAANTKRALRTLARTGTRSTLLESQTAVGAARDIAVEAQQAGIFTVRYANGAQHTVADWADTAVRTASANAYNQGSLVQSREEGVRFMRCFDGANCGLTAHDDPNKVNGQVLALDVADAYPTAHPRCARSWSPEPFISTKADAENARQFDTEQQATMAAEEAARAATATTPLAGRRLGRTARQPRTARAR